MLPNMLMPRRRALPAYSCQHPVIKPVYCQAGTPSYLREKALRHFYMDLGHAIIRLVSRLRLLKDPGRLGNPAKASPKKDDMLGRTLTRTMAP